MNRDWEQVVAGWPTPSRFAWWRFWAQKCTVCTSRLCPVWGAFGRDCEDTKSPAVFILHRWKG
jgi:hypothetical protein